MNIAQTPKESYDQTIQETINSQWDNTDRIRNVKEQTAYPFTNVYNDYEAWMSTVSDNSISVNKNIADFYYSDFSDLQSISQIDYSNILNKCSIKNKYVKC